MTRVLLMRHGQTVWNVQKRFQGSGDSPLTPEGRKQAILVSEALKHVDIVAIYSSPRKRAVETALPLAEILTLPIKKHPGLGEIALGVWEGKTYEEIKHHYPEEFNQFFHDPETFQGVEGGETLVNAKIRAIEAIEHVASKHAGKTIMVVSHAMTIRLLLTHYLHLDMKHLWKLADITQTSISEIVFDRDARMVVRTGDAKHLAI